jgi:diaminopimelate decarboxylase
MTMNSFHYVNDALFAEDVALTEIANAHGTPTYVYSRTDIETAYTSFEQAFATHPHRVCYSVKANSNLGVLNILARLGAGFDIVSGGELQRVLRAGGDAASVVFSGVGKTAAELQMALQAKIACFNVESSAELDTLQTIAAQFNLVAPISIRVNPDVDPGTHPYIATGLKENKFGVSSDIAVEMYQRAATMDNINIVGIDCHIGSQITELSPLTDALSEVLQLVDDLEREGITLNHIDLGGGLGVCYKDEQPIAVEDYASAVLQTMGRHSQKLLFEPGRYIVANAGILLSRVELTKQNGDHHFAVVDAAMNDLIRPALYNAWQKVSAVELRGDPETWSVVGPVCETGDFLAHDRELAIATGDLIAVHSSGAYGFVMSSNYNSRNRAAEVIVSGSDHYCVRQRETIDDQLRLETTLPD